MLPILARWAGPLQALPSLPGKRCSSLCADHIRLLHLLHSQEQLTALTVHSLVSFFIILFPFASRPTNTTYYQCQKTTVRKLRSR